MIFEELHISQKEKLLEHLIKGFDFDRYLVISYSNKWNGYKPKDYEDFIRIIKELSEHIFNPDLEYIKHNKDSYSATAGFKLGIYDQQFLYILFDINNAHFMKFYEIKTANVYNFFDIHHYLRGLKINKITDRILTKMYQYD